MKERINTVADIVVSLSKDSNWKNGDFREVWCESAKRYYWLLGYFGGGGVPVLRALAVASDYSKKHEVILESVQIDEIQTSNRYKNFKFAYSTEKQSPPTDESDVLKVDNFWTWRR